MASRIERFGRQGPPRGAGGFALTGPFRSRLHRTRSELTNANLVTIDQNEHGHNDHEGGAQYPYPMNHPTHRHFDDVRTFMQVKANAMERLPQEESSRRHFMSGRVELGGWCDLDW
ncbi:uncharacterized protein N7529_002548 [Penicillium soppii]|uniref:uncharacterized protein n=1 Tax=Penicillium soppii TaxID=69789 RepID=UPI0025484416|nr:uncharacterized protein N7529_002548 [Penicillium soppii]KAJ5874118.1 hypothetical protein N7529_002548 [Penicillium soppii]